MRWSEGRILTTHAGSLPRPPELVRLYARRARGEAVDAGELEAAGRAALSWVVPKQIEAGVDVGNNGEQQREGFFLYVQHRMSGFGGTWQRPLRADIATSIRRRSMPNARTSGQCSTRPRAASSSRS